MISLGLGYWYGMPGGEPKFLKQGLVAYYPFNGNAKDESENSNDFTVKGATLTKDRHGNSDRAYAFDGNDDFLTTSTSTSDFSFEANAFTMGAWVNPTNISSGFRSILATDTYNTSAGNGICLYQNGDELMFWIADSMTAEKFAIQLAPLRQERGLMLP